MSFNLNVEYPPQSDNFLDWKEWFVAIYNRLGKNGPFPVRGYSVSGLPDATEYGDTSSFSTLIYVYDETGGAVLAFSDGTNWRRVTDRAVVA